MPAIRRAAPGDLEFLLPLCRRYCLADDHPFDRARTLRGLAPLLENDRYGLVWIAEAHGGALAGYAVVTWGWSVESGGLDALLDEIYTEPRNQGIGSALLDAIEADCARRGCARLFLETERANESARRLYRRRGYTVEDSIWMNLSL